MAKLPYSEVKKRYFENKQKPQPRMVVSGNATTSVNNVVWKGILAGGLVTRVKVRAERIKEDSKQTVALTFELVQGDITLSLMKVFGGELEFHPNVQCAENSTVLVYVDDETIFEDYVFSIEVNPNA